MKNSKKNRFFYLKVATFFFHTLLLFKHLLLSPLSAQVILTEVMFDPDTLENHNEFVEIYNAGEQLVNLQDWKIGDGTEYDLLVDAGYGFSLQPLQFALILDPSYFENSTTYDPLIPETALILTIEDGSFGSYGWSNTKSEPVTLINSAGDTVQRYWYSLDNIPGFSDEKIIFSEDNSEMNWANAQIFRGTPGTFNSVMAAPIDLAIDSAWTEPVFPQSGSSFSLYVVFKNRGIQGISSFIVEVYDDLNGDQQADPDEIIFQTEIIEQMGAGESYQHSWSLSDLAAGDYQIRIQVFAEDDTKPQNNHFQFTLRIESNESLLIINEIMFRPAPNQTEWVEFYNKSSDPINVKGWYFADGHDTIIICKTEKMIDGHSYLILSKDSSLMVNYGLAPELLVTSSAFPTLNNDFDDVKVLSFSQRVVDRVLYSNSWMKREVDPGISLERINPEISSSLADNWSACTAPAGATPGQKNSIYVDKPREKTLLAIYPNPFSPDADGFEDVAIFEYDLPLATAYISIDIFDMAGRKIRTLINQHPVGPSGNFIWDGTDDSGRVSRIGLYIIYGRILKLNGEPFKEIKRTLVLMKKG